MCSSSYFLRKYLGPGWICYRKTPENSSSVVIPIRTISQGTDSLGTHCKGQLDPTHQNWLEDNRLVWLQYSVFSIQYPVSILFACSINQFTINKTTLIANGSLRKKKKKKKTTTKPTNFTLGKRYGVCWRFHESSFLFILF